MIEVTGIDLVNDSSDRIKKLLDEMKEEALNKDVTKLTMLMNCYYNE